MALGCAIPVCAAIAAPAPVAGSGDTTRAYNFDSKLLLGSDIGVADIERFNHASAVEPGTYSVDIFVNDVFVTRKPVEFRESGNGEVHPCLDDAFLNSIGVLVAETDSGEKKASSKAEAEPAAAPVSQDGSAGGNGEAAHGQQSSMQCVPLAQRVPGASTSIDMSRLRLQISIPQALMKHTPRGAIDPATLDAGETVAFVNYDANYYTSSSYGHLFNSLYTGINAGMNAGLWRIRQQSALTYNSSTAGSTTRWNNIRTYAERPLISLGSTLLVGESYTTGTLFSSVGYTGVHVEIDDRMLPDSMRGYAPVVNGVANTNARVVVSQNGNVIYQTTVAPGPFTINDLNPTSYQGNLTVQVFEANGQVSTFTVPFSAVPNSLRPGLSHFSATLGQVRQIEGSNEKFVDLTYERGLNNVVTANGGVRAAADYQSVAAGLVFGTGIGAFGVNTAWSHALDVTGKRVTGWMSSINYSHTIQPTMTTFTLAGYRYSTRGYRDFVDALSARAAAQNGTIWDSTTYRERDQFTVNVNQYLGKYGSVSLSASTNSYYGSKARDTQLQLSYNNHFGRVSYNLSFIRQKTGMLYGSTMPGLITNTATSQTGYPARSTNAIMLTVSIPLGSGPRSASASGSFARSSEQGMSFQTSVSGVADEAQTLSYGVTASGQTEGGAKSVAANVQKSLQAATVGANVSDGSDYWQAGASARGAAVVHSGGVTFGPYLGDTFGIVEAKGAEGARVRNAQGAAVNSSGYALVPSLAPYRYNDVALDTKGINANAELSGGQLRVAPYAGSAVLLKFATLTGHALLIGARGPDGGPLPLGANVLDSAGATIGVVGQGSQVYARVPAEQGTLTVQWGARHEDQCAISYVVKSQDARALLLHLDAACTPIRATASTASTPVATRGAAQ